MATLTAQQYEALKQRGLTAESIAQLAQSKGYSLPVQPHTGAAGVAVGVAKGVGSLALGIGQVGNAIQRGVAKVATGLGANVSPQAAGTESPFNSVSPAGQRATAAVEPHGLAENVGKTGVDIATFFIPGAKTTQVAGRVVKGAGEVISKAGLGISAEEAPLVQLYRANTPLYERMANLLKGERAPSKPTTARETALNKNIFGTESMIGVQAKRGAGKVWSEIISPGLKQAKEQIHMPSFINELREEVRLVSDPSRRRELDQALSSFADDNAVFGKISYEKLQQLKEGWAKFLPEKVYKGKPIGSSFREIQNMAAHLARNKIYQQLGPEGKAAYFDYGNLKNLQELGEKALTSSKLKGGAGSFISGLKDMALTPVASTGGLVLYKAGKGLEFVGTAGLKKVRDIFGL